MSVFFYPVYPIALTVLLGKLYLLFLCCVCFSLLLSLLAANSEQLSVITC